MQKTALRNWMKSAPVNAIFIGLDSNARFVGGAVRDALLGKDAKDIDIATPYTPEEVTAKLQAKGIKIVPTGIKHGTVTAVTKGGDFEITTLRRDVDCFGRHAEVEFTDNWAEDAARRDFTINAMSCTQNGEIFDYFCGMQDLEAKKIRFVGDAQQRCKEDYLRILRFFRFFAYYGAPPADSEALAAFRLLANGIDTLSGERIQSEMFKLLTAPDPIHSLHLMVETGVMPHIIQGIDAASIAPLEKIIKRKNAITKDKIFRLAVLINNNLDSAVALIKRWRLSNLDKNRLLFLCNPANRFPENIDEKTAKKYLRVWGAEKFLDMCFLCFAYGMKKELLDTLVKLQYWDIPKFPLAGHDLANIGLQGKEIGQSLEEAEKWWEENGYKAGKKELLEFVKKLNNLSFG